MKLLRVVFATFILAALVGSLSLIFGQTKNHAGRIGAEGQTQKEPGQRPDMPPLPPRGRGFHLRVFEELNLTDAQKTQIKTLHENARTASEQYMEQIKGVEDQIKALVQAKTFNEEQARQILNTKAQAETELQLIHLRTESAIYNLLTAEQKAKLEEIERNRPQFPRGGEGFRQGPPPPPRN